MYFETQGSIELQVLKLVRNVSFKLYNMDCHFENKNILWLKTNFVSSIEVEMIEMSILF